MCPEKREVRTRSLTAELAKATTARMFVRSILVIWLIVYWKGAAE